MPGDLKSCPNCGEIHRLQATLADLAIATASRDQWAATSEKLVQTVEQLTAQLAARDAEIAKLKGQLDKMLQIGEVAAAKISRGGG